MTKATVQVIQQDVLCPCGSGKPCQECCLRLPAAVTNPTPKEKAILEEREVLSAELTQQGVQLQTKGKLEEALACFNTAIDVTPRYTPAYFYRGRLHFEMDKIDEMRADFYLAMDTAPKDALLLQQISIFFENMKQYRVSIPLLRRAVELDEKFEMAWMQLAESYSRMGDDFMSRQLVDSLCRRFPDSSSVKFMRATWLPHIPLSNEQIDQVILQLEQNLDRLLEESVVLDNPEREYRLIVFYHVYYGRDTKRIACKLAQLFLKAHPSLGYVAPHCLKPPRKKEKIRLGFYSESLHRITVNQFFNNILKGLYARDDIEVVMLSNSPPNHRMTKEVIAMVHKFVPLPGPLAEAREIIAKEEIDVLTYLEIGVSHQSYFLAFARLAPVQCVQGGLAVTTGIPNMDYFLTVKDAEPEHPERHYSETPVLFDRLISIFDRPKVSERMKSRIDLGLPDGDIRLYTCPVMLHKIHPDMDMIFANILKRDEKARIILFDPDYAIWRQTLHTRFEQTIPAEVRKRILFLPFANRNIFLDMMRTVDCVMDTLHYSFATTAYLMLCADAPFVTWPGEFMRGRTAYLMFKWMDIPELIANTHEEFAEIAVRLANDKAFYAEMAAKIKERKERVFNNEGIVGELTERLKDLYARAVARAA